VARPNSCGRALDFATGQAASPWVVLQSWSIACSGGRSGQTRSTICSRWSLCPGSIPRSLRIAFALPRSRGRSLRVADSLVRLGLGPWARARRLAPRPCDQKRDLPDRSHPGAGDRRMRGFHPRLPLFRCLRCKGRRLCPPAIQPEVFCRGREPTSQHSLRHQVDCGRRRDRVRTRGFATSFGEHKLAVNAVAVPVFDSRGSVVAALEIRASGNRIPPSRVLDLIAGIREAAAVITESIGGVAGALAN